MKEDAAFTARLSVPAKAVEMVSPDGSTKILSVPEITDLIGALLESSYYAGALNGIMPPSSTKQQPFHGPVVTPSQIGFATSRENDFESMVLTFGAVNVVVRVDRKYLVQLGEALINLAIHPTVTTH